MRQKTYQSPEIKVVAFEIEKGFAGTVEVTTTQPSLSSLFGQNDQGQYGELGESFSTSFGTGGQNTSHF